MTSLVNSARSGTVALLYGYLPPTLEPSMSSPWEHVNTVSVKATISFRVPVIAMLAASALLLSVLLLLLLLLLKRLTRCRMWFKR